MCLIVIEADRKAPVVSRDANRYIRLWVAADDELSMEGSNHFTRAQCNNQIKQTAHRNQFQPLNITEICVPGGIVLEMPHQDSSNAAGSLFPQTENADARSPPISELASFGFRARVVLVS